MNTKDQHRPGSEEKAKRYQCPMRCEENKVYNHPGNCPVCNMKLVPVGDKAHGHDHH